MFTGRVDDTVTACLAPSWRAPRNDGPSGDAGTGIAASDRCATPKGSIVVRDLLGDTRMYPYHGGTAAHAIFAGAVLRDTPDEMLSAG